MKDKDKNLTGSEKVANKLNDFLVRNRRLVLGISIAIVVVIIAICVAVVIMQNNVEKKFNALSDLEGQYSAFYSLDAESEEYKASYDEFQAASAALIASAGLDSYPGAKAQLLAADLAYNREEYQAAADGYASVAAAQADTYLGQLALMNEAASYENLGDQDRALELYNQVFDTYGQGSPYAPKALFNAARLYEATGNAELAKATFEQLTGLYLVPENGGQPSEYARMAEAYLVTME